jgi:hypothetical protein
VAAVGAVVAAEAAAGAGAAAVLGAAVVVAIAGAGLVDLLTAGTVVAAVLGAVVVAGVPVVVVPVAALDCPAVAIVVLGAVAAAATVVVPTPYEPHAVSLGVWQAPQFVPLPWSPLAFTPLWQVAQVTPVTTACAILQVVAEPPLSKLTVLAWQEVQSAATVGICPVALA